MYSIHRLLFIFTVAKAQNPEIIKYYDNLIVEQQVKNFAYQLPTNSKSFLEEYPSENPYDFGDFDFIVVGAGRAGTVIARRLSEKSEWRVLLLEAGQGETDFSDIPAMTNSLQNSEIIWPYNTTSQQKCCLGMVNEQCTIHSGKVLGGSSATNEMIFVRGNRYDYNGWENKGNKGWGYKEVLPYFKKLENFSAKGDSNYHGFEGPLNIDYTKPPSSLLQAFINANEELGRKEVDYNGKNQLGVGRIQFNLIQGRRDSGAKAYLKPIKNRRNLNIVTGALVLKILIDRHTKTAFGVKFILGGNCYFARTRKEVILSAGAVNSPQLLMLSGVGEKNHLEENGIPTVHNLPGVGRNLQNHIAFNGIIFETNYTEPVSALQTHVKNYLNGVGLLTQGPEGVCFSRTNKSRCGDYPDLQYIFTPPRDPSAFITPNIKNYKDDIIENFISKINFQTTVRFLVVLLHPRSRGTVRLKNKSSYEFPDVDLNGFSCFVDIEALYEGVLEILQLLKTEAFKRYHARLVEYSLPACEDYEYMSRSYWLCNIQHLSYTMHDLVGTCKMGPSDDVNAVVDSELQVYGIPNLRVADCSIMPEITSGDTNAPAFMIGEKAADMLKQKYE